MARQRPSSLLKDQGFMRLWTGETLSQFGSQFSPIAIQVAATKILDATSFQFGLLSAANSGPFLLFALYIGVLVDRHKRKRTMVLADFSRAAVLGSVPVAALLGFLSMNLFYIVAFLAGTLTVFFDVAYQSYLPSLVGDDQIVDANGKLETSSTLAQLVGPSIAGFVCSVIYPPLAVAGDALGYTGSASFVSSIKKNEPEPEPRHASTLHDMREGLNVVFGDVNLRSIAGSTSTSNLFSSALFAIYVPYLLRDLGVSILGLGLIGSIAAAGGVLGALTASRVAARIGVGPAIVTSIFIGGFGALGVYFATPPLAIPFVGLSLFVTSWGSLVYNINQVSYRQVVVPGNVQGRMNATMRFLVWGTLPIGGLVGGVLGEVYGLHGAIGIAAFGSTLAFLWVLLSPVRKIKEFPLSGELSERRLGVSSPGSSSPSSP